MSIEQFLADYLTHESAPLHRETLLNEVVRICRVSPDAPKGKRSDWQDGLDALIQSGDVIAAGERVQIVRRDRGESSSEQPSLF